MQIISELKRRNVFRVGLFYIVSAWLVIQVAETLLPIFEVPDAFIRGIVLLLVLGFVPALIFAWVFELTPDGIKRETATPAAQQTPANRPVAQKMNIATLVIALLAIGLLAADRFVISPTPGDSIVDQPSSVSQDSERSIAVLAFEDLSPAGDQEYFADGISEELLNLLARIDALKVAARTSSFRYKGTQVDIAEIGRALNVDTVLEGSVRKAGDQLRITAQLIDAESGFHLWSESYDRRLDNVFAVQDEIAEAIVDQLRLEFDVAAATAGRTNNEAAYDLYLQGRSLVREPSRDRLLRAVDLFDDALALDPEFVAAWSGIADAWLWLEDYGGFSAVEAFPKAERAARRALALDATSAEALASMGRLQASYYDDPTAAEPYFLQAIDANPSFIPVYSYYSDTLLMMGRMVEASDMLRRAVELDPLSRFMRARLAGRLQSIGAVDEARAMIDRLLAEDPTDDYALEERANLRLLERRFVDAIADYRRVHIARPGDAYSASRISHIATYMNHEALLDPWIQAARDQGVDNRWELQARITRARRADDFEELRQIGMLQAGESAGVQLQATAALRSGELSVARSQLLGALRLASYEPGTPASTFDQIQSLIDLAWVERQLELDGWSNRLQPASAALERFANLGSIGWGDRNIPHLAARAAAVEGARDQALEHLRFAMGRGFFEHWFLAHDPVFAIWRDDREFIGLVDDMLHHAAAERERLDLDEALP